SIRYNVRSMYLGCRFYPFVYVEFSRIPLEKSGLRIFSCTINCQTRVKRGVGAETLSEFFSCLRLEGYVGCSPSALRTVMHTLERLILETAAAWEKEGIAHGEIRPVI